VALSAAATGDGELATIALTMAERGTGADRKFADWAVHGYKQMALCGIEPEPRAQRLLVEDPDVGGLRMRYGQLSSVFTSGSFGYTLAGTMTPKSGLAGAYPLVRLDRLAANPKYEFTNLHIAGWRKPEAMIDIHEHAAAAAGVYQPHNQRTTWRSTHVTGPWRIHQAWLYLPDRMIGLMTLRATLATEARSAEHIYRLMAEEVEPAGDGAYDAGDLRLTIVDTSLSHQLIEPGRKVSMSTKEPWRQIVLTDRTRPTQSKARETVGKTEELLPMQRYKAGDVFHSLVEIRRIEAPSAEIKLISFDDALLAFGATVDGQAHLTAANFAAKGDDLDVEWNGKSVAIPAGAVRLVR
jgi:hypothetical protein